MAEYTPGPWEVVPWDGISKAIRGPTNLLAQTVGGNDEANARLITAAPDMYEALKQLTADPDLELSFAQCKAITTAIAKAEGRE